MSIFSNVLLEETYDFDYMIESINMDSIYINESFTDNIKAIWNKIKELWNKFKKWLKEKLKIIRNKIIKIISKVKKNKDNDDKNDPDMMEYYTCEKINIEVLKKSIDNFKYQTDRIYEFVQDFSYDKDYNIFKSNKDIDLNLLNESKNDLIDILDKINIKKVKDKINQTSITNIENVADNFITLGYRLLALSGTVDFLMTKELYKIPESMQQNSKVLNEIKNIVTVAKTTSGTFINVSKLFFIKYILVINALEFNVDQGLSKKYCKEYRFDAFDELSDKYKDIISKIDNLN